MMCEDRKTKTDCQQQRPAYARQLAKLTLAVGQESASRFVGCGGAVEFVRRESGRDSQPTGGATPGRASDGVLRRL